MSNLMPAVQEQPDDVIDLMLLWNKLWHARWWLPPFLLVMFGLAALYLNTATYRYTATQVVTAAEQSGSSVPSGISSLGSLVGVDIGGHGGSSFVLFPKALTSEAVAEALTRNDRLMQAVFPGDWDDRQQMWREYPSTIGAVADGLKSMLGVPISKWQPPNRANVRDHLERRLVIAEDTKKNIIAISYAHPEPAVARMMVETVVREADDFLRAKSLVRANDYVDYLEGKLRETDVGEYRMLLAQALVSYEHTRMMASAKSSYAAELFGPSSVTQRPTSPKAIVVLAVAFGLGLFLWGAYALLLAPHFRRKRIDRNHEN